VHAAVDVQLTACTCSISTSPSYMKPGKLTLNGQGFLSEIFSTTEDQSTLHLWLLPASHICKKHMASWS